MGRVWRSRGVFGRSFLSTPPPGTPARAACSLKCSDTPIRRWRLVMLSRAEADPPLWKAILGLLLRVVAVLLALVASLDAFFASMGRLEGSYELRMIERLDLEIGAMFAFALLLFFAPDCRWNPKAWLLAMICAAVILTCVSGWL